LLLTAVPNAETHFYVRYPFNEPPMGKAEDVALNK
jgi:hypothetical protein